MLRDFERQIILMARHFGMAPALWDVMGGRKFKTKEEIEQRNAQGEGLRSILSSERSEEDAAMSAALEKAANKYGIKSLTVVTLAYVMAKAPNVFPLVGGRKVEHLQDNIQAPSLRLTGVAS